MVLGEYESLKAIRAVSPTMAPEPYSWGKYDGRDTYFLLTEFREVGKQPADPSKFTKVLAEMHRSPSHRRENSGSMSRRATPRYGRLPIVGKIHGRSCSGNSWPT
jgi:hypothetical protein